MWQCQRVPHQPAVSNLKLNTLPPPQPTEGWQRRREDSILAQPGEAADIDLTLTVEEEKMDKTLDGKVLEELDEEHGEVEEGEASQGQ